MVLALRPNQMGVFKKISQIGNVLIEDNVEIGSNTTIDRATMGSTTIREGAKLDNLIQIAHNVEIGSNTVIASQVGAAQFAKIGAHTYVAGHTVIDKDVPPFIKAGRDPLCYVGLNSVGLQRRGYSNEKNK